MTELLPLFPLGTVLLPGMPLQLHIFEDRYRVLVRDLVDRTDRRWFGVVGIRRGHEVGDERPELYDVGCVAVVRRIDAYPDGRYDIEASGGPRFRIGAVDDELPYLRADVALLEEQLGSGALELMSPAATAIDAYWAALRAVRPELAELPAQPTEPLELSYRAAAVLQVAIDQKQALLECADAASRITAATGMLRRETALVRHFAVVQTPAEQGPGPFSLN